MSAFKIGDKIRALDSSIGSITAGKIYEVGGKYFNNKTYPDCVGIIADDFGRENGWTFSKFELVTEDAPAKSVKWNKGDVITCTSVSRNEADALTVGDDYIFDGYDEDGCVTVVVDDNGESNWFYASDVTFARKKDTPKVGDKVRCLTNEWPSLAVEGDVCTITRVEGDGTVDTVCERTHSPIILRPKSYELITETKGENMATLKVTSGEVAKTTNKFLGQKVDVERTGSAIILPETMGYSDAIEVLQLKMQEDETKISIYEDVDAFPLDGAYAFMRALQQKYGWATPVPTKTFFGDVPPTTVNLPIAYGETTQIIWGDFKIPGIDGKLTTKADVVNGQLCFVIAGVVKQKYKQEIKDIANLTRQLVKDGSIYKGQAVRVKTDDDGQMDMYEAPTFMDLSKANPAELVFSTAVGEQVQTNLFTPIEHTETCRANGIPLKRGILLEGPYGTGKTMTAYVTAKKAHENGWSFIYLDRVTGLKDAIQFAKRYAPAVIFAEDIDRVVAGGRSVKVDDVLNNIDGVDSKHAELITILTTNHVENIEQAMLRPGRLDAVISVRPPDAAAAERLVRLYARGLLAESEDLSAAAKELDGQIPAVIREVVERSKLYAISHMKPNTTLHLTGADLTAVARGMKDHLLLLAPKAKEHQDSLTQALTTVVQKTLDTKFNGTAEHVTEIYNRICD